MARKHVQTETEWEEEKSIEILAFARNELYLDLPFMGIALGGLEPQAKEEIRLLATDGNCMYFNSVETIRLFQKNTQFLERMYLHSIFHCVFSHLWLKGERNPWLWGVACDIAVEYTIDTLDKSCTRRALSWIRTDTYKRLKEETTAFSAQAIYYWLLECSLDEQEKLMKEFVTDDHRFWPKEENGKQQNSDKSQNKWNKIARQTSLEQKKHGNDKSDGEQVLLTMAKANRNRRSYKEFLQKFAILREEMHQDPDEFDLGYYTYGLKIYENMPLLEPLETKENRKIQEFVIVVDTSYSTNGKLIQNFLTETFSILTTGGSFFHQSRVRILQCDTCVRWDREVKSANEIEALMRELTIVGGGGTDFRPAFAYVDRLREEGQLKNLSGLLYFTDGKGTYPAKRPDYKTAFLFMDEYDDNQVPVWAIRMRLYPEEFGGKK